MTKRGIPIIEVLESGDTASGLAQFVQTTAGDVQVKTPSGVQTIATSNTVASAVAKITVKNWAASTAMDADEVRRATVAAGTIEAGDLIRSNSARTTGATFDATEAGNWTEFSPEGSPTFTGTVTMPMGTATTPPIRLVAGTNLTTPIVGAVEFDGADLFLTI